MVKKIILTGLIVWPIVIIGIVSRFHVDAFTSVLLFYGIPAIPLSLLRPRLISKALVVSLFGIPSVIIIDYIAELTRAWFIPFSIFPFRILSLVTIEVVTWVFFHIYVVVLFYEYFFEKNIPEKIWSSRSNNILASIMGLSMLFIGLFFIIPHALYVPYWYLVFGTIAILSVVVFEELKFPKVFPKLLKTAVYFFYVNLIYEVVALKNGWWSFPGNQFIGQVSLFGATFPFEEFFFWIMLFTLCILSLYEYFFDDER